MDTPWSERIIPVLLDTGMVAEWGQRSEEWKGPQMKKILPVLILMMAACASSRHRHHIEDAEYELPCTIEGVRFLLQPTVDDANVKCGKHNADDGKPLKDGEIIGGCFNPQVTLGNEEGDITFSGTIISPIKWEIIRDEMEHLIFHACRVGRITWNDEEKDK